MNRMLSSQNTSAAPDMLTDEQMTVKLGHNDKTGMSTFGLGNRKVTVAPDFGEKLMRANADMVKATGYPIVVNSSYRTKEKQQELYDELKPKGAKVATPGTSRHEKGLAVDIGNWREAASFLKKYGIENPFPDDRNHFQFTDKPAKMGDTTEGLTTGQKVARAVAPYSKHALPFAGAALGGVLAAPGNLIAPGVAEAAGIGLGGAAGVQLDRLIQKYAGTEQQPTQGEKTFGKKWGPVVDAATDVTTMMGVGALAPEVMAAKPGLEMLQNPLAKATGTGAESVLGRKALSQETGVPLSPAQMGQAKSTTYLEGQLRKNMWSADEAATFDTEQAAALRKYGRKVQEETFGGGSDALAAGEEAQARAWKRYRAFQGRASKIYDSIPVEPTTQVGTPNLSNVAKEHLEELGKFDSPAVKRILKLAEKSETPASTTTSPIVDARGRPITTETPPQPTYTWEQLRSDQSELGKLIERTPDHNKKRILRDLLGASNDDIATFSQSVDSPEIANRLATANKFYRQGDESLPGVKVWRERQIANMMKTQSPEDIGKNFFKANPNQSDIERLKAAAGPRGFQEIKKSWLEDMLTRGEDQSFSHNRFITAYDRYRRSGNLDVMLNKSEREGLDKLYDISRAVAWSERIGGNPSGTGHIVINNLYKMIRHPVWAVSQAMGAKKLSQNYFKNPEFQKKLVDGLKLPAGSIRAKAIARQLALVGVIEEREEAR